MRSKRSAEWTVAWWGTSSVKGRIISAVLLLALETEAPSQAAHVEEIEMAQPPALPLIVENILPGEGWVPGTWKAKGSALIYNAWTHGRHRMTVLHRGERFTLLSGLCVVNRPDVITVTATIPRMRLNPGDSFLRYMHRGEGWADFWAKGRWYSDFDGSFVTNANGTGCRHSYKARETKPGRRAWWLNVRLSDGRAGWTDALDNLNPNWIKGSN